MKRFNLILILFIIVIVTLYGESDYSFEQISIKNGISNATISGIAQDSKGFLWIATRNGLNRYDGKNIKIYQYEENNPNSLRENYLNRIYVDDRDILWITSQNGLTRFDIKEEKFEYFTNDTTDKGSIYKGVINVVYKDGKENLWVGNGENGVQIFNEKNKKFSSDFKRIGEEKHKNKDVINSIIEIDEKELFIGNNAGVEKYNADKKEFKMLSKEEFPFDRVNTIFKDSKKRVWVLTESGNLVNYDNKNKKNTAYDISKIIGEKKEVPLRTIVEDETGKLWIGTWGYGVIIFNPDNKEIMQIKSDENLADGLKSNLILSMYKDMTGIIWIGTDGQGINKYDYKKHKFNLIQNKAGNLNSLAYGKVTSICEDSKGNLWMGIYDNGISILNKERNKFTHLKRENSWLSENRIFYIKEDKNKKIWVGTNCGGINIYNPETQNTVYINSNLDVENAYKDRDNILFRIYEDRDGDIWLGSYYNGVTQYKQQTKIFKNYGYDPEYKKGISNGTVNTIFQDSKGYIWIGTDIGLNKIDKLSGEISVFLNNPKDNYSISHSTVTAVEEDNEGNLWFGTLLGLNKYEKRTGRFFKYGKKNGFLDETITSILKDNKGVFWIGTMKGLVKFSPVTESTEVFTEDDGLQSNQFYWGSCFKSESGELYFGGLNGVNYFRPEDIKRNITEPKITITAFKKFNEEVRGAQYKNEFEIQSNENYFSIEFAAMDYSRPEKNRYAYMIEGVDKNWIELEDKNYITFSNLRPGNYVIKLKAANNDLVWNKNGISIRVKVLPPWWNSITAYIIYFILVVLIINIIFRYNLKLKTEEEVAKELKKERDRAESASYAKSQFLANMSHEIRTPMNGIMGMTNILLKSELNEKQRGYLEMVKSSSEMLLKIINNILDISKIEAGKMEVEQIPFNLKSVLNLMSKSFEFASKNKRILFFTQIDKDIPEILIGDVVKTEQIIINLVNNALKFTERGSVLLSVSLKEKLRNKVKIVFSVIDTGIGIPEDRISKIFESYIQVDATVTRKYGGTGLGLTIVKSMVELLGGTIDVKSKDGSGTTFEVILEFAVEGFKSDIIEKKMSVEKLPVLNILVVEDNKINQEYMRVFLEYYSQVVTIAENGEEGVRQYKNGRFDLILMDENMPVMNGIEAARIIREIEKNHEKHIKIAALTAEAIAGTAEKFADAGMDYYLTKPIDEEKLIGIISKIEPLSSKYTKIEIKNNIKNAETDIMENNMIIDEKELFKNFRFVPNDKFINMLEVFLTIVPEKMDKLKSIINEKDNKKIDFELHSLKGTLGMFFAKETFNFVIEMEKKSKENKQDTEYDFAILDGMMEKVYERVREIIMELKK